MSFKNHYCWWGITVPKGRRISLLIEDIDIDELTFFLIFEGAKDGPNLIKREDIKAGATYETSDNGAHIIYWQTIPSTRRGVKISYTSEKPTGKYSVFLVGYKKYSETPIDFSVYRKL